MASILFKFENFTFVASGWTDSHSQRIEQVVIPRRDGALVSLGRPDVKRISIQGMLTAATAALLRTAEETMLAAFRNTAGGTPVGKLRRWDDKYILAQLDSWNFAPNQNLKVGQYQASFLAASPYWQSDTLNSQNNTPNADPYTCTLTGAGTAPAMPIFTVTATNTVGAGLKLVNGTANMYLQLNAAMTTGDVLVIDCDAITAAVNGVNVLASLGGDFWPILPGANTITVTGLNGIATVNTQWRDCWH
jgi:phage-related protein